MANLVIDVSTPDNSQYSPQDMNSPAAEPRSWRKDAMLEVAGTALFVYISLSGVHQAVLAALGTGSAVDQIHISICFALGLTSGIIVALKSGAHLNSSVSFTLWLTGQMPFGKFLLYVVAQMLGGGIGALMVVVLYYSRIQQFAESSALIGSFGTLRDPSNSLFSSIMDQIIGSALLMFGILKAPNNQYKPLVIGAVLGGLGLFQGSNGFAFNMARDLAPRIVSTIIYGDDPFTTETYWFWVPMCMPFVGMPIGWLMAQHV